MTVLVDTHVLQWWSAEPNRLSRKAARVLSQADEVAVAAISWFELAWLAHRGRIMVTIPVRSWLEQLAQQVRTVNITPAIADTAVSLSEAFPADPADRLIFATAVETGWSLVTKDSRLLDYEYPRPIAIW